MSSSVRTLVTLSVLLGLVGTGLVGCAGDTIPPPPEIRPVTIHHGSAAAPIPISDIVQRFDLSEVAGAPSGIAVEPDTGRRLLLLQHGEVVDLDTNESLWSGTPLQGGTSFSDVVALGDGQIAITSVSDGYLVDLRSGEMTPHFCYEPGWWEGEGEDPVQISQAVAHDAERGILYAQPRTITAGGFGEITESFVSAYDEASGADVAWWGIDDLGFVATGMAMLETGRDVGDAQLLLAAQHTLYTFDGTSGDLVPAGDLSELEVSWIEGIALDRASDTLLVLDAGAMQVVEIRLGAIGL